MWFSMKKHNSFHMEKICWKGNLNKWFPTKNMNLILNEMLNVKILRFQKLTKKSNCPSSQLFVNLPIFVVSPKKVGATPKVPTKKLFRIIGALDWDYLIMHVLLPWMNHWHDKKLSKEETWRNGKKLQMKNIMHLWKTWPRISLNYQKKEKQ